MISGKGGDLGPAVEHGTEVSVDGCYLFNGAFVVLVVAMGITTFTAMIAESNGF